MGANAAAGLGQTSAATGNSIGNSLTIAGGNAAAAGINGAAAATTNGINGAANAINSGISGYNQNALLQPSWAARGPRSAVSLAASRVREYQNA
jgi:hypothetical protein